ncbi:hypothetical protein FITA111629_09805 [Filibacter tadaridae]|uniref:Uncharacterized protein n=1 Tax=Filibacter tadaridae TaxID=2483811 RepID=A0A3P5XSQ3_9BACL|nr:hypothetical protein [Filibacter tadaridae]VDC32027.1 hypothetical protein FILTAD_02562 [Filibacter tadaridae]
MDNVALMGTGNWLGILSTLFFILCFYFTLTFFQHLKSGDERLIKQTKLTAVFCLVLGLLIPAFYSLYIYNEMMR